MSRRPLGKRAMTATERQARYRSARAGGQPIIRFRRILLKKSDLLGIGGLSWTAGRVLPHQAGSG